MLLCAITCLRVYIYIIATFYCRIRFNPFERISFNGTMHKMEHYLRGLRFAMYCWKGCNEPGIRIVAYLREIVNEMFY